jgi:chemosensory pili system protein ChpA (sensor histidine kinase/response regulator)
MARKVEPEILVGFIEEARSYLPTLRRNVAKLQTEPGKAEALEEAHRYAHTIKGAASMVGLAVLSHMAYHMEETLEEIGAGQLSVNAAALSFLSQVIDQIEHYLDSILKGGLRERPLLTETIRSYRRLHGLPEAEDETAIEKVISQVEEAPLPAIETKTLPAPEQPPAEGAETDNAPDDLSPELVEAFSLEAEDHLRNISADLAALEQQTGDRGLMESIRRSVHTLKGAAGAVGYKALAQLAHRMEDLLDLLYTGSQAPTPETISLLLDSTDALQDLAASQGSAAPLQAALQNLYTRYNANLAGSPTTRPAQPLSTRELLGEAPAIDLNELAAQQVEPGSTTTRLQSNGNKPTPYSSGQVVRVPIERLDALVRLVSELVIARTTFEQRMTDFERTSKELLLSTERLRRVSATLETEYEVSALGGRSALLPVEPAVSTAAGNQPALNTYGFDALEFDHYTEFHRLSRELTETTSDINAIGHALVDLQGDFDSILARQGRLSSELQDKLMRVRMVPLATLTTRLQRAVRSVSKGQDKQVALEIEGEHIELDKTVLEEMADPLMHLLRNAVDHGIEPAALRQALGKAERGLVRLSAYYEGSQVVIQVKDDGAGLEPQALRAAAINKGFVSSAEAAALSDEDLCALVFLPGFSTAGEVSEVSGRGVGLDVVKTSVHKLKGTLAVDSTPGQGTAFTIRLPMTLAVTRALLVRASGETFAIPLDAVTQILRLERDKLELVGQDQVVRLGSKVYPAQHISHILHLKQPPDENLLRLPVLTLKAGGKQIAMIVDQILGGREIVVKTLGSHLRRVPGITGATLMGDGRVILILNPADLINGPDQASHAWRNVHTPAGREALNVLVVDDSMSVRRVVSNLVQSAGWQPSTARDGLEALETIQNASRPPDVILLDIEMPRMDGYEFMATLRNQQAYHGIPIIVLTSRAGEKHRQKALELGASEYLVKPYQDQQLLNCIQRLAKQAVMA